MKKKKGFGIFDLFTLGFGAIIGVGWSITLHRLIIAGGGPIPSSLGFIISMIIFIFVGLIFAELASAMPVAGGAVTYGKRAFGNTISFIVGWFLLLAYAGILPFETVSITEILSHIIPGLNSGPILYHFVGYDIRLYPVIVSIIIGIGIVLINRSGTKAIAHFQNILTIVLIIAAFICIGATLINFKAENLLPLYQSMPDKPHNSLFTGIICVCALTPMYYSGFDTIPQSIEDAKGVDKRKMGKIVASTVVAAGIFYLLVILSSSAAYPWTALINLDIPVLSNLMLELYPGFLGTFMYWVTIIGAAAGLFTTWNSFYVASSRLMMSLGRNKLIPEIFAKVDKKDTPYIANIFCAVIMLIGPFLGMGVVDVLSTIGSFGFAVGWMIACLCFIKLRIKEPQMERPYKLKGGMFIAVISTFFCAFMVLNCIVPMLPGYMGDVGFWASMAWVVLGIIFYGFKYWQNKKAATTKDAVSANS